MQYKFILSLSILYRDSWTNLKMEGEYVVVIGIWYKAVQAGFYSDMAECWLVTQVARVRYPAAAWVLRIFSPVTIIFVFLSYWKNFVRTLKRVRVNHGKRIIGVRSIEVRLYDVFVVHINFRFAGAGIVWAILDRIFGLEPSLLHKKQCRTLLTAMH